MTSGDGEYRYFSIMDDLSRKGSKSFFFKLYAFILLTSTLVPGINYFSLFRTNNEEKKFWYLWSRVTSTSAQIAIYREFVVEI